MKMVEVRFNENSVYNTRSYGFAERHVISEEDAKALGSSVEILGDAPNDFPQYDKSVFGDNEAARQREPKGPADEPQSEPEVEDQPAEKAVEAPSNKMVGKAPVKK